MSTFPAALAYVLLETHLTVDTPALGTPADYRQLVLPNQQATQREGVLVLLHHSVRILRTWHTPQCLAAYLQHGAQRLYLVVTYLPPLSVARRAQLDPAEPGAAEEQMLAPLREVLEAIPCADETVLVVGDMNARTASRCPDLPDHPPRDSVDTVMTSRGTALLRLCTDMGLWLLNGTSLSCRGATSYHSLSYDSAQSVVDYALASPIAHALGIRLHVEDPFLDLSDHGILRVELPPLPGPMGLGAPQTAPRMLIRWEAGM